MGSDVCRTTNKAAQLAAQSEEERTMERMNIRIVTVHDSGVGVAVNFHRYDVFCGEVSDVRSRIIDVINGNHGRSCGRIDVEGLVYFATEDLPGRIKYIVYVVPGAELQFCDLIIDAPSVPSMDGISLATETARALGQGSTVTVFVFGKEEVLSVMEQVTRALEKIYKSKKEG